ncbi:MAG: RDD family protein, partial [Hydrogenophaga sp.]|nr:RDD family protein [Hydrogenophaga sp.]
MTTSPTAHTTPSLIPDDAAKSPLQAPPLLRRMACWLYEGMLMFGVVFIAGYLFSTP